MNDSIPFSEVRVIALDGSGFEIVIVVVFAVNEHATGGRESFPMVPMRCRAGDEKIVAVTCVRTKENCRGVKWKERRGTGTLMAGQPSSLESYIKSQRQ